MATEPVGREEGARPSPPERSARRGLTVARRFVAAGTDPYETVEWEIRSAVISGEGGETVFEQRDVEVPRPWSQLATNVVVSKYFRGPLGTPERERSVRQLIGRVVSTVGEWGEAQGYFATPGDRAAFTDELTHLLLHQKASFNSPVWFNMGVEPKPQCSACFILSVDDTMDSILDWYRKEGIIFKGGSGSGVNLSRLRSSRERLGGGGTAVEYALRHQRRGRRDAPRARPPAPDRRGDLAVRRSRHAVRYHHQRMAHLPEHGAHQRVESVLRIHAPRRQRLQPRQPEPDAVRRAGRELRRRGLPARGRHHDHRAGHRGRPLQLPHARDRGHRARLPRARPGLREPGRAPDVARPPLR